MDDNIYPNDGAPFVPVEPTEQKEQRKKEKGEVLAVLPVLRDIISRMNERIAFYDSINSIPLEARADPELFVRMYNANQLTRDNLRAEKEWLEGLIDDYTVR